MPAIVNRKEEVEAFRLASSQPESLSKLAAFADRLRDRVIDIALRDPSLQARLEGVRNRVVAVDYRQYADQHVRDRAPVPVARRTRTP